MSFNVRSFSNPNIFASNLYVINSESWNLLIDPSFFDDEIKKYLDKIWWLDGILITHWHGDHIRAIDRFVKFFPEAKVYIHSLDCELLKNIQLNCSFSVWNSEIIIDSDVEKIQEWSLKIWWYDIQVINFQWHTYWSVMYYFPKEKILFTWDTIMSDSIWTPDIPTWDINLLMKSVQKFKALWLSGDTICYPWHGKSILYADILKNNPYLNL